MKQNQGKEKNRLFQTSDLNLLAKEGKESVERQRWRIQKGGEGILSFCNKVTESCWKEKHERGKLGLGTEEGLFPPGKSTSQREEQVS